VTTILVFHTLQNQRHDFSLSHSDPSQPDLLGLVANLIDDDSLKETDRMTAIVTLDEGKTISEEQFNFDGIGLRMMLDHGVPLHIVMDKFAYMARRADRVAAYSVEHHLKTAAVAATACDIELPILSTFCLMKRSTNYCKLPTRNPSVYKMPKLMEAYLHFAKRPFAIPYSGSHQDVLDYHLEARNAIFRGIRKTEEADLKKGAKPVVPRYDF